MIRKVCKEVRRTDAFGFLVIDRESKNEQSQPKIKTQTP